VAPAARVVVMVVAAVVVVVRRLGLIPEPAELVQPAL
jgi:hypothetical protein